MGGQLELLDLQGRILMRQVVVGQNATLQVEQPAGMYLLRFTDRKGNALVKRVVLR